MAFFFGFGIASFLMGYIAVVVDLWLDRRAAASHEVGEQP
jgi:hypothetical protein